MQLLSQPWSVESLIGEVIRNDAASYVVAEDNGKIVGYAGMWQMFDEAHMTNIAVAAEYRCRGIATNLILCLMRTAKANGGKRMSANLTTKRSACIPRLGSGTREQGENTTVTQVKMH